MAGQFPLGLPNADPDLQPNLVFCLAGNSDQVLVVSTITSISCAS